jgi:hypothetical protein
VDLIRSVAADGKMVSAIFSSFYSVIPLLTAPPETYCASDLLSSFQESNFLQWHPYLITYLLALPVKYVGISALKVTSFINAINITGALALIYLFLRRNGLFIWECMIFIFAVSIADYWVGTIAGQFYFDRLFILPGLLLVFICYEKWNNNYPVWLSMFIVVIFVATLISERTALYASVLTLGYWVISKENKFSLKGITLLLASIAGLAYLFIYMKFFQNSIYYNGMGWNSIVNNLSISLLPSGTLFNQTMAWLIIVLPMLLFSFVNWRYGLLAIAALIPNLLVSVGGAEKTGFLTHYHAGYIPFLIGYAAIGYLTLIVKTRTSQSADMNWISKHKKSLTISVAILLCSLLTSRFMDTKQTYYSIARISPSINNFKNQMNDNIAFFSAIAPNQTISSPEWTMPTLEALGMHEVDYMPIGIGINRYIIAQYISKSGLPEVPSYLPPAKQEIIAGCIQQKISSNYHIKTDGLFNGQHYIIYEKNL